MPETRAQRIRRCLQRAFAPLELAIEDESWRHADHAVSRDHGGGHFRITITSTSFTGQSRLARHRMIHEALQPLFASEIHALAITARAPGEA